MSRIDRKYIEAMKTWQGEGDTEISHKQADRLLIQFLRELSYNELADEYEKVDKWYA